MTPPVFAHGHLRLYLLSLLAESDTGMHGYELIQALGDRFGGTYVPSAGTIYPRLAKLEEEGLVTKTVDGRKTVYEITEAGRAAIGPPPEPTAVPTDETKAAPAELTGKVGAMITLLRRPDGATVEAMMAATGWQAHSVRGAMSGAIKKDRGLVVTSDKTDAGRVYRIVEGAGA